MSLSCGSIFQSLKIQLRNPNIAVQSYPVSQAGLQIEDGPYLGGRSSANDDFTTVDDDDFLK